jgi:hypothetical protein
MGWGGISQSRNHPTTTTTLSRLQRPRGTHKRRRCVATVGNYRSLVFAGHVCPNLVIRARAGHEWGGICPHVCVHTSCSDGPPSRAGIPTTRWRHPGRRRRTGRMNPRNTGSGCGEQATPACNDSGSQSADAAVSRQATFIPYLACTCLQQDTLR